MKGQSVRKIEFVGGPEDGRVIDAEAFLLLSSEANHNEDYIPLIVRDNEGAPPGEEAEFRLLGLYVMEKVVGETLLYHWAPVPA